MRTIEAILADNNANKRRLDRLSPSNDLPASVQTIEVNLAKLESAGRWGATQLEIGGKLYQLFPVEAA